MGTSWNSAPVEVYEPCEKKITNLNYFASQGNQIDGVRLNVKCKDYHLKKCLCPVRNGAHILCLERIHVKPVYYRIILSWYQ